MTHIIDGALTAGVRIEEGKITAEATDREADLYLDTRRNTPLSSEEQHATLGVVGEEFNAEIGLDGYQIDALADALHDYQEELREGNR